MWRSSIVSAALVEGAAGVGAVVIVEEEDG